MALLAYPNGGGAVYVPTWYLVAPSPVAAPAPAAPSPTYALPAAPRAPAPVLPPPPPALPGPSPGTTGVPAGGGASVYPAPARYYVQAAPATKNLVVPVQGRLPMGGGSFAQTPAAPSPALQTVAGVPLWALIVGAVLLLLLLVK